MDRKNIAKTYKVLTDNTAAVMLAEMIAKESYDHVIAQVRENHIPDREIYRAIDVGSRINGNRKTAMMDVWLMLMDEYGLIPKVRK